MGIDIFTQWNGQTQAERDAQCTGFSKVCGCVGYLREAYHGEPYATKFLCAEAFEKGGARIEAKVLRDRLPRTLVLSEERERSLYNASESDIAAVKRSFSDFVALCERKESETGEPVLVIASY